MHFAKSVTCASVSALLISLVLITTFVSADAKEDCLKECDKIDITTPEWNDCVIECVFG